MNLNDQQKDANESKVEEGVNQYGCTTGLKVAKLDVRSHGSQALGKAYPELAAQTAP